jgi:type VI secretion system protein VasJ
MPADLRNRILESLSGLEETTAALLPDFPPLKDMASLIQRLRPPISGHEQAKQDLGQNAPPARPGHAAPAAPAREIPPMAQEFPPAQPSDDPAVLRRRFIEAGREYLVRAMRMEPANASLWRLSRLVLWSGIVALPQAEGNRTLLPAPDTAVLELARRKLEAGNALEAAFAAEEFMATAPFCLDVQPVVFKALSALGPQFAEAAQAVRDESSRFAARLPGLEKLSFNDGTPLASPQTAAWLPGRSEQSRTGPEKENIEDPRSDNSLNRCFAAARELLAQDRLPEALDAIDAAKTASPSTNMRFRAAQLRVLCEAGEAKAALALAGTLLADSAARDLDNWDPGLALEALLAAQRAFLLFDAQNTEVLHGTLSRITRIQPSAALG